VDNTYIPRRPEKTLFRLLLTLLFLSSCTSLGGQAQRQESSAANSPQMAQGEGDLARVSADDRQIIAAQSNQESKVEVTVTARVKKLLPDDTRGLQHQKFLLILSNGTSILVANDLTYGQRVPIQPGDVVKIHGEYIWNRLGGLIHWTHRSDTPRHESGWIEFNGQTYQ